jgi:hypothetical protein
MIVANKAIPWPTISHGNPSMLRQASQSESEQARKKISDTAEKAGEQIKEKARSVRDWVSEQAQTRGNEQKDRAADGVENIAKSVHALKDKLDEQQLATASRYVESAADRIEQFADYLRQHDVQEMRRNAEQIARNHPGTFLGSLLLAGVALGRFLRSSSELEEETESSSTRQYQSDLTATQPPTSPQPDIPAEPAQTTAPPWAEQARGRMPDTFPQEEPPQ